VQLAQASLDRFGIQPLWQVVRPALGYPMTNQTLDAAMERYAQGDDAAFREVYGGLDQRLRAFLRRLCGAAPLADDLLQETFLRVHRARGSFSHGAAVIPWAYAIARNSWLDHLRAAKTRGRLAVVAAADEREERDVPTGPDADSEQAVIAHQTAEIVQRVLAALPSAQREAFVLLRYEGLSVHEAAEIVGATPTAVKLRAFRAYEALREALGVQTSSGAQHEA
jgi:RNA polymerase sigma-70 factor (ECF subfamily)